MDDLQKEQVSALLDGELDHLECQKVLSKDGGHSHKKLDRYALIRGAMQSSIDVDEKQFLSSIKNELEDTPTVLSPIRKKAEDKRFVVGALAATFAIFTASIFDFTGNTEVPSLNPVASIEAESQVVAESQEIEPEQTQVTIQPQFVTFEK